MAGLRPYLNKEYNNLLLVDLVCHGVSSPEVWNEYLMEVCGGKEISNIAFRDKTEGWSHFSIRIDFRDGTRYIKSPYKDPFMNAYLENIILRPSCYHCHFKGIKRASDITLADFWGVKEIVPKMFDDKGISLVCLHSDKAYEFFTSILSKIRYEGVSISESIGFNKNMEYSVGEPNNRKLFFEGKRQSMLRKLRRLSKKSIKKRIRGIIHRARRKCK